MPGCGSDFGQSRKVRIRRQRMIIPSDYNRYVSLRHGRTEPVANLKPWPTAMAAAIETAVAQVAVLLQRPCYDSRGFSLRVLMQVVRQREPNDLIGNLIALAVGARSVPGDVGSKCGIHSGGSYAGDAAASGLPATSLRRPIAVVTGSSQSTNERDLHSRLPDFDEVPIRVADVGADLEAMVLRVGKKLRTSG